MTMKRTLGTIGLILFLGGRAFAGNVEVAKKIAGRALDAGGLVHTAAENAQTVWDHPLLQEAEEKTRVLGVVSDLKDAASIGTTGVAVAGASGSGVMSTLASGAIIGSGVVAGAATTAAVGGAGAASLMNKYVFNGDTKADENARVATYGGAVAGTAASAGALLGAGAGPAGLAAIGSLVGGGMAAGAIAVLAAPAVAAVAAGGVIYWLWKDD